MKEVPLRVRATIRKLIMYPIVVSFCWTPLTIWDMYTQVQSDKSIHDRWEIYYGTANILAISQGLLFSCVFFGMNPMVRGAWVELFFPAPITEDVRPSGPADVDEKSGSLVSVSINGAGSSASDEHSLRSGLTSEQSKTRGRHKSWFSQQPISLTRLQQEDDFLPAGDTPLSQRSSLVDFLATSARVPAVPTRFSFLERMSLSLNFARDKSSAPSGAAATEERGMNDREQSVNPMTVEFSDLGSVRLGAESAGTGSATMSIRLAAEGTFESDGGDDEESGITSMTGGTGADARRTSLSSVGTTSTAGTRVSKGSSALPAPARAKK
jgi:hypothetical protein